MDSMRTRERSDSDAQLAGERLVDGNLHLDVRIVRQQPFACIGGCDVIPALANNRCGQKRIRSSLRKGWPVADDDRYDMCACQSKFAGHCGCWQQRNGRTYARDDGDS
jgi:hypothetical protein